MPPDDARAHPSPTSELSGVRLAGLAVATLGCILVLGHVNGLETLSNALTGKEAQFETPPPDPDSWDDKRGNELRATLGHLAPLPQGTRRVVMLGNSQQYTVPPPSHEAPSSEKPRITSMRLEASLNARKPGAVKFFNGASDNQNFGEALWQALYWLEVADPKPSAFVLQASFDTLRKTGVRGGYQTLLDEPRFVAALERELAKGDRPYHPDFLAATKQWSERQAALASETKGERFEQWSPEPALRAAMNHVELFRRREENKGFFLGALYAVRVRALGISPRTRRHIAGAPLEQNLAALEDLITLGTARGAKVVVYNAPTNPSVDMFYPEEYAAYVERLRALASRLGARFEDLGGRVPAEHWGFLIDGPDPIHFDEVGHETIHDALVAPLAAELGIER